MNKTRHISVRFSPEDFEKVVKHIFKMQKETDKKQYQSLTEFVRYCVLKGIK